MPLLVLCRPCLQAREQEGPQSVEGGESPADGEGADRSSTGPRRHSCRECPRAASPGLTRPARVCGWACNPVSQSGPAFPRWG